MLGRVQANSAPVIALSAPSRSFHSAASRIIPARPHSIVRNPRPFLRTRRAGLPHAARPFSSSTTRRHGHIETPKPGEELWVTFVEKDGQEHKVAVSAGDNLLDIAQAHDLEMEGACGGSCACSTCHVIVQDEYYDKIPEPDDDENDMLDLAFGLTETSRLGCQIIMTPELDGLKVKLPSMTRNLQASDFKP
ncbi:2Fe-2S ferredoxin-type domain-containing protein [Coniella lustricola]|uniref:2Fe-2S ferredoxin-type domain-containing protein n=1 Tax=Coniella lustricola TaxID=2025994 RepID=A0A2T3A9C8_9PEZI|nr:2Fe-2S ferredoxin-type domain-containing protein [Coniella lustricola]